MPPPPPPTPPRLDVAAALRAWDGKDLQPFRDVASELPDTVLSARHLLRLAGQDEAALSIGATWVLKNWLEQRRLTPGPVRAGLLALLATDLPWETTLHLLQMLPHLEPTVEQLRAVRPTLKTLCDHPRPFVRAWAYNGLGLLARDSPGDRPAIEQLFDQALDSQPASVNARIRNVRKSW